MTDEPMLCLRPLHRLASRRLVGRREPDLLLARGSVSAMTDLRYACIKCGNEAGGSSLSLTVLAQYRGGYCRTCRKSDAIFRVIPDEPKAVARRTDPLTSHAAAESVTGIRASQGLILELLRQRGPATDEDVAGWLAESGRPFSLSGARTRRSELVTLGLVFDTERRRRMRTGRMAIIWQAIP